MSELEIRDIPDWQAINAAHRRAESEGLVDANMLPVGTLPLTAAFGPVETELSLAAAGAEGEVVDIFPTHASRKSNGFGGRGKTARVVPFVTKEYREHVIEGHAEDLRDQVERLDAVAEAAAEEIEAPWRKFVRYQKAVSAHGEPYVEMVYVLDEFQIDGWRAHEREVLTQVVSALRVGVLESHPRTRGYPGARRLAQNPEAYRNAGYLRYKNKWVQDPVVDAFLDDLEQRMLPNAPDNYGHWSISDGRYGLNSIDIPRWMSHVPYSEYYVRDM